MHACPSRNKIAGTQTMFKKQKARSSTTESSLTLSLIIQHILRVCMLPKTVCSEGPVVDSQLPLAELSS